MAFPNLLKRLFDSNGAGVTLRGDIMPYGTAAPKAHGTAAAGSAETLSRSDHVHPLQTSVSGNAGSATKLAAKRTIDGMQFDGSANITHYGTCSTAAATAAKTVTLPNFVLATGALAFVRFTVTNTASSPTLNVNATGAKAIRYRNATISAGYLAANRTYCFIYDGSYYQLVGDIDTNTKCSVATTSSAGIVMPKTGDEDGLELGEDGSLRVRQASASQRGSVLASTTAAANAVPQAGEDGTLDESWVQPVIQMIEDASPGIASKEALGLIKVGTGLAIRIDGTLDAVSNTVELTFTESNPEWTAPETAIYTVTCVGGGGRGGSGGKGYYPDAGKQCGGGGSGGSSGKLISTSIALTKGDTVPITVGGPGGASSFGSYITASGGINGNNGSTGPNAPGGSAVGDGKAGGAGNSQKGGNGGAGGPGYSNAISAGSGSNGSQNLGSSSVGIGAAGGKGYGAGGGGGGGGGVPYRYESVNGGSGGNGAQGVVIIRYTSTEEAG